jgi:hypothetical protein
MRVERPIDEKMFTLRRVYMKRPGACIARDYFIKSIRFCLATFCPFVQIIGRS